jgi:hypothetical protein
VFFSPETFEQLMPARLTRFYPGVAVDWGIGLVWAHDPHPDAGKAGVPQEKTILSRNTIGHGAGSGAILRIDLDNDLVVAQVRSVPGPRHGAYVAGFLMAIAAGLDD